MRQYHIMEKGVRDAGRYLARVPMSGCTISGVSAAAAQNLAITGRISGGSPLLPSWSDTTSVNVAVAQCFNNAAQTYRGREQVPVIEVSAAAPYVDLDRDRSRQHQSLGVPPAILGRRVAMLRLRRFQRNESGSTLVEYTLVFLLLMLLTFGLIEFGVVLYQYNAAETATAVGARYVATRGPFITGISDCGVATSASAGTACRTITGSDSWTMTCNAGSPSGACQSSALTSLVTEMQRFAPNIEAQNVQVVFRGTGLGFVGRGSPVPMVTVRLTGMQYDFVALDDLLGFGTLNMPGFDASSVGEDLNGAGA
jgi:Flp pilus assembly pilin Flp